MPVRDATRRVWFGLSTLLGRRRGFFIPYRYADHLVPAGGRRAYQPIEKSFAADAGKFAAELRALDDHADALRAIGGQPAPAPRWEQDWFPRLDAAMAYSLVRRHRPARIVEVGSGHSTRFLVRAVEDGGLATEIVAIDPAPRAALRGLRVEWLPQTVPGCGLAPFQQLAPGDVVFIDSSHILMPGTDVDFLLNEALPILPAGVLLHLHDIFLPDDYPASWGWRGYNEQLGVAALLDGRWETLFASRYVATRMSDRVKDSVVARLPLLPGAFETSLWLRRSSA
jgi:predicted O-methyltransferase YrrM